MLRTNKVFCFDILLYLRVVAHQYLLRPENSPTTLRYSIFSVGLCLGFQTPSTRYSVLGFESHGVGGILSHELDWCIYSGVLGVKPPALLRVLKSMLLLLKLYLTKR